MSLAKLHGAIVNDALVVIEILDDIIGDAADEAARLVAARLMVARLGMLADRLLVSSGTPPHHPDPMAWLMSEPEAKAFERCARLYVEVHSGRKAVD
jgi:hypothetical protein